MVFVFVFVFVLAHEQAIKTQYNDDMAAKAGPANLNIIIDVCYARLNPTGAVDKIWPYIT